jgi:hypothetical protein
MCRQRIRVSYGRLGRWSRWSRADRVTRRWSVCGLMLGAVEVRPCVEVVGSTVHWKYAARIDFLTTFLSNRSEYHHSG